MSEYAERINGESEDAKAARLDRIATKGPIPNHAMMTGEQCAFADWCLTNPSGGGFLLAAKALVALLADDRATFNLRDLKSQAIERWHLDRLRELELLRVVTYPSGAWQYRLTGAGISWSRYLGDVIAKRVAEMP